MNYSSVPSAGNGNVNEGGSSASFYPVPKDLEFFMYSSDVSGLLQTLKNTGRFPICGDLFGFFQSNGSPVVHYVAGPGAGCGWSGGRCIPDQSYASTGRSILQAFNELYIGRWVALTNDMARGGVEACFPPCATSSGRRFAELRIVLSGTEAKASQVVGSVLHTGRSQALKLSYLRGTSLREYITADATAHVHAQQLRQWMHGEGFKWSTPANVNSAWYAESGHPIMTVVRGALNNLYTHTTKYQRSVEVGDFSAICRNTNTGETTTINFPNSFPANRSFVVMTDGKPHRSLEFMDNWTSSDFMFVVFEQ
eukprot:CAMPEP_0119123544 /NCGR_PEP_ID=MMETSP1310-20130426/3454_1 /TAXON_ID=464262 /ORGANISM="Genus nov. species nov., Strain RCC2339" /LENGTH=309 /DNA_ID=CAMNT_0007113381 /DNA_START=205 /DNA_END=1134 /DNA_ORIENTATION=-